MIRDPSAGAQPTRRYVILSSSFGEGCKLILLRLKARLMHPTAIHDFPPGIEMPVVVMSSESAVVPLAKLVTKGNLETGAGGHFLLERAHLPPQLLGAVAPPGLAVPSAEMARLRCRPPVAR